MIKRISIREDVCTGCRSCEIACSYGKLGIHQPSKSLIKVYFDVESNGMDISINNECNLCKGKDEPLCIKYCSAGALVLQNE
ncbi:MAG: hypothetical protein NWF08_04490 [Candidatus Bathyarchaeota archaeon]|nr:hypothetical protein [Candidatus Bathyarchaeota archaeon]